MTTSYSYIRLDQPAQYLIKVQGRLDENLSDWFSGAIHCTVDTAHQSPPVTCLTGVIVDQAALHGLLQRIRDLGLVLLYVDCLTAHKTQSSAEGL